MGSVFEAEQCLLANVYNGMATKLRHKELTNESHQIILDALERLEKKGTSPDLVTLKAEIESFDTLENVGGFNYLEKLSKMRGNPRSHSGYEQIIRNESLRRAVVAHAENLLWAADDGTDGSDLLQMAQTQPLTLGYLDNDTTYLAQDVAYDVLDEIHTRRTSKGLTGIGSPWRDLDELTSGFQKKDLIIVAGRPSMGKTALGGQIATYAALNYGPTFVGSLEMDRSSLVERMLVGDARIDAQKVRSGKISQQEYERLQVSAERLQDYHPLIINDSPRLTAQDLRLSMSQARLKYNGLSIAVIDYLGLIASEAKGEQRYREVGEACRILRATAKELDMPVILLCQLNRDCEQRENKRPLLSDLRESGDIEQDSDMVLMLYRDEYYCKSCSSGACDKDHVGVAELICRKQRKGPTGTVALTWMKEHTQFGNFDRGFASEEYREWQHTPQAPPDEPEEEQREIPF